MDDDEEYSDLEDAEFNFQPRIFERIQFLQFNGRQIMDDDTLDTDDDDNPMSENGHESQSDEEEATITDGPHNYLFCAPTELPSSENTSYYEPFSIQTLPCLVMRHISFPGQRVAMKYTLCNRAYTIMQAVDDKMPIILYFPDVDGGQKHPIGCLLQLTRVEQTSSYISAVGVLRDRVELIELPSLNVEPFEAYTAQCRILRDLNFPSPRDFLPSQYAGLPEYSKLDMMCSITNMLPWVYKQFSSPTFVETLWKNMTIWYSEEAIDQHFRLGLKEFVYWAASHLMLSEKHKYALLCEDYLEARLAIVIRTLESLKNCSIVCRKCSLPITELQHVIRISQDSVFINNYGFTHDLITFQSIAGFEAVGRRSMEYTWFPEYSWLILRCIRCHNHIGWEYASEVHTPAIFYGLTRRAVKTLEKCALA